MASEWEEQLGHTAADVAAAVAQLKVAKQQAIEKEDFIEAGLLKQRIGILQAAIGEVWGVVTPGVDAPKVCGADSEREAVGWTTCTDKSTRLGEHIKPRKNKGWESWVRTKLVADDGIAQSSAVKGRHGEAQPEHLPPDIPNCGSHESTTENLNDASRPDVSDRNGSGISLQKLSHTRKGAWSKLISGCQAVNKETTAEMDSHDARSNQLVEAEEDLTPASGLLDAMNQRSAKRSIDMKGVPQDKTSSFRGWATWSQEHTTANEGCGAFPGKCAAQGHEHETVSSVPDKSGPNSLVGTEKLTFEDEGYSAQLKSGRTVLNTVHSAKAVESVEGDADSGAGVSDASRAAAPFHLSAQPTGPDGRYAVVHDRVAVRSSPATTADILTAVSRFRRLSLSGTPYAVDGAPWLRLDERTCEALGIGDVNAWVLIHGGHLGLNELLVPMDNMEAQERPVAGKNEEYPTIDPTEDSTHASSNCPHMPVSSSPIAPDGYYEIVHTRVAIRKSPSTQADVLGVLRSGQDILLFGTPYDIEGNPWLRLDWDTCEQLHIDGEDSWVLIHGANIGLGELLKPHSTTKGEGNSASDNARKQSWSGSRGDYKWKNWSTSGDSWTQWWYENNSGWDWQQDDSMHEAWDDMDNANTSQSAHITKGRTTPPVDVLEQYAREINAAMIARDSDKAESLHRLRANLYRNHGDFDQALADADICVKLKPQDPMLLFQRGTARLEAGGQDLQALGDLRAAQNLGLDVGSGKILEWLCRARHWSRMRNRINHYRILGVPADAAPETIKQAYKSAALRWHPDKPGGNPDRFREVQEAWQVLGCSDKRAAYDFGNRGQSAGGRRSRGKPGGHSRARHGSGQTPRNSSAAPQGHRTNKNPQQAGVNYRSASVQPESRRRSGTPAHSGVNYGRSEVWA